MYYTIDLIFSITFISMINKAIMQKPGRTYNMDGTWKMLSHIIFFSNVMFISHLCQKVQCLFWINNGWLRKWLKFPNKATNFCSIKELSPFFSMTFNDLQWLSMTFNVIFFSLSITVNQKPKINFEKWCICDMKWMIFFSAIHYLFFYVDMILINSNFDTFWALLKNLTKRWK